MQCMQTLEKTEEAIRNGQSRDTSLVSLLCYPGLKYPTFCGHAVSYFIRYYKGWMSQIRSHFYKTVL